MKYETYLAHHGVKGMHWGVRRYQPYPDGVTPRKKGEPKPPNSVSSFVQKKKHDSESEIYKRSKSMTDDELRAANKRYQLEQQYRQNAINDARASRSQTERILRKSGNIFLSAAIGAAAGAAGAYVGKKIFNGAKDIKMSDITTWANTARSVASDVPTDISWARYRRNLER